ncbi:GAF domain-containing protein [Pseudooceanicola sp. CBS1P-1]|uniref:histidine kinase n=1 Tax=Pseudooceanicola albus TaxID=2692189 RepID=A0A6L7GAX0_9RHOB|nr:MULTISPECIES: HWE histidine kinase domain-containing protein [Pseudooceanicola]MBT9386472.1 GAF domain-containing protein [Pseudooceanicola endophyticus]MXN20506.1 GAF domain-containing protein [Pseudooceanicola albus]
MPQSPEAATDLTNCDREPIHLLGRVQSYGALLAVSSDWIVQHASDNLLAIFGVESCAALGRPLSELISPEGLSLIRRNLHGLENRDGAVRLFAVPLRPRRGTYDICLHQSGNHILIELEPKHARSERDLMTEVYPQIAALRRDRGLTALARDAARALQALSGFDSVMVYQFQPDLSGRVIAESRLDGKNRYDGLMFPASDIPVQARALYKRSLLRLIADVDDPGSPVRPGLDDGGLPLDLSLAVTRAVSPIHIEYLRNMKVRASMSVSIMKDGELWGLFACHNATPHYIDYERRTAIEMFAHMFAYELSRFEETRRKQAESETNRLQTRLMAQMADGHGLSESLMAVSEDIAGVIPHDGIILFENDTFHARGRTPSEEEFRSLARYLDRSIGNGVHATDRLSAGHPPARDYAGRCAGLLAIPISKRPRDYLVLCRREVRDTVEWAGEPAKAMEVGPNGTRLTPRRSFEIWQETVEGRSVAWSDQELHSAELLRIVLLEIFLKITDASNLERKRAQEQQQLLISELNHRVRNILNLMRGLLAQTRSSARTMEEFTQNLDGRIHALARAHDQLTSEQWEPASLCALIRCEIAAYASGGAERLVIEGPDAMISPQAFTTMALVLHELATNSVKYGALKEPSGRVNVTLKEEPGGSLSLAWIERGGPAVTPPKRRGFGTMIIEGSIPHELKGDADVSYRLTGLEARFRLPAQVISSIGTDPALAAAPAPAGDSVPTGLTGTGIVLEDTLIIAMDAAGILEDMGAEEVKIFSGVQAALRFLEDNRVDFALLDVNLGEEQSIPVAERLHTMGTPFVLATGYGATPELLEAYPPCVVVQKPFSASSLAAAFTRAQAGDLTAG